MGLEAEIEALKRQNRRLKVALFSTITLLLLGVATVVGTAAIAATQAKAEAARAMDREQRARARAEAVFARAQEALGGAEIPNDRDR